MPFKSKKQQRYMFARHPRIARRWADEYGVPKNLPEKAPPADEQTKESAMLEMKVIETIKAASAALDRAQAEREQEKRAAAERAAKIPEILELLAPLLPPGEKEAAAECLADPMQTLIVLGNTARRCAEAEANIMGRAEPKTASAGARQPRRDLYAAERSNGHTEADDQLFRDLGLGHLVS